MTAKTQNISIRQLSVGDCVLEVTNDRDQVLFSADKHIIETQAEIERLKQRGGKRVLVFIPRVASKKQVSSNEHSNLPRRTLPTDPDESGSSADAPGGDYRGDSEFGAIPEPLTGQELSEGYRDIEQTLQQASFVYNQTHKKLEAVFKKAATGEAVDLSTLSPYIDHIIAEIQKTPACVGVLMSLQQHNDSTFGHCINVAMLALLFGQHYNYPPGQLEELVLGGLMHDIGKIKVPDKIIASPAPLSDGEYRVIQRHPEWSRKLLTEAGASRSVIDIAYQHHERMDGSGYPRGITQVIPEAHLLSILDVYDALVSQRSYNKTYSPIEAYRILQEDFGKNASDQKKLMEVIQALGVFPPGTLVRLNTGEIATVINITAPKRRRGIVGVLYTRHKKPVREVYAVDLKRCEHQTALHQGDLFDSNTVIEQAMSAKNLPDYVNVDTVRDLLNQVDKRKLTHVSGQPPRD